MSTTLRLKPFFHYHRRQNPNLFRRSKKISSLSPVLTTAASRFSSSALNLGKFPPSRVSPVVKSNLAEVAHAEAGTDAAPVVFKETFQLNCSQIVEGSVSVKLRKGNDGKNWELTIRCNLPGKWILHWGVTYASDVGREWAQPPPEMRPPDSILIKDYAMETPFKQSQSAVEGQILHEVQIDFNINSPIASINFVLKEEETGAWYQHCGRDFKLLLTDFPEVENNTTGGKKGFSIWPGLFYQISNILRKSEGSRAKDEDNIGDAKNSKQQNKQVEGFYEEYCILKEEPVQNSLTVSVRSSPEIQNKLVHFDTDLPGNVMVHWGVSGQNDKTTWEIPAGPLPPDTKVFRQTALQTSLQPKENGNGSWGLFSLDKRLAGLIFVLKLNDFTWVNNLGHDFFIPLSGDQTETTDKKTKVDDPTPTPTAYTDDIINEIRNLVSDISSEKRSKPKYKEGQERILQEIEKLAAEAYSIFRSSTPTFLEEPVTMKPPVKISSGTGTGYEILCQGFNWESHKSGKWYLELNEKAKELASLGFTIIWLPPPTDSVSSEGYMPTDLYNLNSRYGSMEELKILVKRFHEVGVKVLGDVVLNHRCAQYQNKNGIWNIFGGRMNWDDRAVVADDPHFQGRGNKSSGDNFHAAPNIDHSQDFVRKDLKEWLGWLRNEIGYDGWRLDFVRGFWGGYVKDYLDATEPYFAVGEYWDSLSYNYGDMEHNQDAHRQRIVDWINATNGTAGAFDVTTKGILHAALEKCEYWRLSDEKGRPPGVLGWWPSRAVTFIENHDTGSTQGHWRFPSGKEMQGYAYILTHPGTPAVFYDHIFSHYHQEIAQLLSLRHRNKIHCRSSAQIVKADRDVYAASIDDKVMMKIGPGHYDPPNGPQKWNVAVEGRDYKIWEASS